MPQVGTNAYIKSLEAEIARRERQQIKKECEESLLGFIKHFWHCVEPSTIMVEGWVLDAICSHLESITYGHIKRLIVNVPPGSMKSLSINVFWPAWEWGPQGMSDMRYISTSRDIGLTERDNERMLRILQDEMYQEFWGGHVVLERTGVSRITNTNTGFKLASSVTSGTGRRGNRIIIDDPNSTDPRESESDKVRTGVNMWMREVMPDRLNNLDEDSIVLIQQRVHEDDATGCLLTIGQDWTHLMIPMEYDPNRHCVTTLGYDEDDNEVIWEDPRSVAGELCWPERFSPEAIRKMKIEKGPYAFAAQYNQEPSPRGGGIIRDEWWQAYDADYARNIQAMAANETKLMYPPGDITIVSLDPAYTTKQENDFSACTAWRIFKDNNNNSRILLVDAWHARLSLHGVPLNENDITKEQKDAKRGLVERVAATAKRHGASHILIEAKASGIDIINEFSRLHASEPWIVVPINPRGDKAARLNSVVPLFTRGMVYAPGKVTNGFFTFMTWAEEVMAEIRKFPKGKHDDFVDSTSQALIFLRDVGAALRPEEEKEISNNLLAPHGEDEPLYPV